MFAREKVKFKQWRCKTIDAGLLPGVEDIRV